MGEERTEPHDADRAATEPTERRATVGEAAGELGITAEAVRSRVKRGTLKSIKQGSTVYVLLGGLTSQSTKREAEWNVSGAKTDRTTPEHDRAYDQTTPEPDQTDDRAALLDAKNETIEELRDRVASLERQIEAGDEARRRADTLLAQLTQANASMAGQIRELTAPERTPGEPESVPEASDSPSPHPDTVGAQEGVQEPEETARRPWWLRWFGG